MFNVYQTMIVEDRHCQPNFHEVWLFMIILKIFRKYSKSMVNLEILKISENFEFFDNFGEN